MKCKFLDSTTPPIDAPSDSHFDNHWICRKTKKTGKTESAAGELAECAQCTNRIDFDDSIQRKYELVYASGHIMMEAMMRIILLCDKCPSPPDFHKQVDNIARWSLVAVTETEQRPIPPERRDPMIDTYPSRNNK